MELSPPRPTSSPLYPAYCPLQGSVPQARHFAMEFVLSSVLNLPGSRTNAPKRRCFVWHQEDAFPKKMAVSLQPDQRLNQFHHAVAKTKSSVSR